MFLWFLLVVELVLILNGAYQYIYLNYSLILGVYIDQWDYMLHVGEPFSKGTRQAKDAFQRDSEAYPKCLFTLSVQACKVD